MRSLGIVCAQTVKEWVVSLCSETRICAQQFWTSFRFGGQVAIHAQVVPFLYAGLSSVFKLGSYLLNSLLCTLSTGLTTRATTVNI